MVDKMEDIFHCFNPNFYLYNEIARDSNGKLYKAHCQQSVECFVAHIRHSTKTIFHFRCQPMVLG